MFFVPRFAIASWARVRQASVRAQGTAQPLKIVFCHLYGGEQTRKGTEQVLERKLFKKVLVLLILFGLFFDTYLDQDPYYLCIVAGPRPNLSDPPTE